MTNIPQPPPRHLQHGAPAVSGGPFGGKHAARIRAIASSSQLPTERARADAIVMTAWLTAGQRAQYAPSLRAAGHGEDFVEHRAAARRVAREAGPAPPAAARPAARRAARSARQLPLRILETLLVLGALACFTVAALRTEYGAGMSRDALPDGIVPLLVGTVLCLIAGAVVGAVATRRRDHQLLDWAVSRPGQLGRGLPLRRPLQGGSVGPALLRGVGPAVLVAAGVIAICVGAAILLITLLSDADSEATTLALWLLGGGVLALLLAVIAVQLRGRRLEQIVRRARAAEWFGAQGAERFGAQAAEQNPDLLEDTGLGES